MFDFTMFEYARSLVKATTHFLPQEYVPTLQESPSDQLKRFLEAERPDQFTSDLSYLRYIRKCLLDNSNWRGTMAYLNMDHSWNPFYENPVDREEGETIWKIVLEKYKGKGVDISRLGNMKKTDGNLDRLVLYKNTAYVMQISTPWKRVAAGIIDSIIVVLIQLIFILPYRKVSPIPNWSPYAFTDVFTLSYFYPYFTGISMFSIGLFNIFLTAVMFHIIMFIYELFFYDTQWQATPGKRMMSLIVLKVKYQETSNNIDRMGAVNCYQLWKVDPIDMITRLVIKHLSNIIGLPYYLMNNIMKHERPIYDRMTEHTVLDYPYHQLPLFSEKK